MSKIIVIEWGERGMVRGRSKCQIFAILLHDTILILLCFLNHQYYDDITWVIQGYNLCQIEKEITFCICVSQMFMFPFSPLTVQISLNYIFQISIPVVHPI